MIGSSPTTYRNPLDYHHQQQQQMEQGQASSDRIIDENIVENITLNNLENITRNDAENITRNTESNTESNHLERSTTNHESPSNQREILKVTNLKSIVLNVPLDDNSKDGFHTLCVANKFITGKTLVIHYPSLIALHAKNAEKTAKKVSH